MTREEFDGMTAHEATVLANQVKNYTFLTSLVIWYDVLLHISVVSKTLQSIDINVSEAVEMLESTKAYFDNSRTQEKFVTFLMCLSSSDKARSQDNFPTKEGRK